MKKNGEDLTKYVIEQYKLYVEMADRVSTRRSQTNSFYITLLSALMVIISFIVTKNICSVIMNIIYLSYGILGITLCLLWILNIKSYKQLNSGKFKVIAEIEHKLPLQLFKREWEILGGGKDRKKYFKLTKIEMYIPLVLLIPYLLIIIYSLYMCIFGSIFNTSLKTP